MEWHNNTTGRSPLSLYSFSIRSFVLVKYPSRCSVTFYYHVWEKAGIVRDKDAVSMRHIETQELQMSTK